MGCRPKLWPRAARWLRAPGALVAAACLAVPPAAGAADLRGPAPALSRAAREVAEPNADRARGLEGEVVRVVDGDTIHVRLAHGVEKVRYIGVNTPELHHPRRGEEPGGREALEANRQLVGGRRVRLELDVQTRDRYGRLLAYVWVGPTMVNAELLRLGWAQVMTVPPNVRYQERLLELQRAARTGGRGLWGRT